MAADHSSIVLGETQPLTIASWARYVPGPSPEFRYKKITGRYARSGIITSGAIALFLSGYNLPLMGSITSVPSYLKTIGLTTSTSGERLLIGFIGALYFVGVMLGALISGWLSDKVGRRRALICASVWGCIIVPIFAASQNLGWVISTRILNGVATGAFDSIGLNWCAETVSHKKRGRSIGFQLCSAAVGASSCYFIIYGMIKQHTGEIVWRFPMAFQLVCFVSVLILVPLLPESPRWLVKVGMHNEAQLVLIAMAHDNVPSNEDAQAAQRAAALEVATIAAALEEERAEKSSASYFSMFLKRDRMHTLRRTWSAFFIQFATQAFLATGYLAGYGIVIFETSGWSSDTAALLAGMVILTQAVCGLGGAFLADRLGRRVAMMTGTLSGAVFLSLLGMCAYFVAEYAESDPGRAKAFGNGALVLTLLWGAQYGLTFLWFSFTYPSEIFPAQSRARGSSVGIAGFATGSFLANMVSTYIFNAIGWGTMFLLSGTSFMVAAICYFFMPETANKTLEEIDHLFD